MKKYRRLIFFIGVCVIALLILLKTTYFLEKEACFNNGGGWNYQENTCKTLEDARQCRKDSGIWIQEENLCDFGEIIN